MDIKKAMEELSISYLSIVSAMSLIAVETERHDDDSADVHIKKVITLENGRKFNSQVTLQLKSTHSISQYTEYEDCIKYKLNAKNYNDLCMDSTMPSLLGLLILPIDGWTNWTPSELILNGRMYWTSLKDNEETDNTGKKTVTIPKCNHINSESLIELLEKAAKGELR